MNSNPQSENKPTSGKPHQPSSHKPYSPTSIRRGSGPWLAHARRKSTQFKGSMKQLLAYPGKYKWTIFS